MLLAAREQGEEDPRMLHNFIEFLYLYGHFVSCFHLKLSLADFLVRLAKTLRKKMKSLSHPQLTRSRLSFFRAHPTLLTNPKASSCTVVSLHSNLMNALHS